MSPRIVTLSKTAPRTVICCLETRAPLSHVEMEGEIHVLRTHNFLAGLLLSTLIAPAVFSAGHDRVIASATMASPTVEEVSQLAEEQSDEQSGENEDSDQGSSQQEEQSEFESLAQSDDGIQHLNAQSYRGEFAFVGPPTISLETYRAVYCQPRYSGVSDACSYAPEMYERLVNHGLDPVIELAFAAKESELGTTGPGRAPQHNLHNIVCNSWDRGTCEGPHHRRFATYPDYIHSVESWIHLMLYRGIYVDAGNTNFRQIVPIYAPPFENNTAQYIAQVEGWVRGWREWDRENQLFGASVVPAQNSEHSWPIPADLVEAKE